MTKLQVPAMGLVLLIGVSGSGKSSFAARHFQPTQVISSDACRALISDDASNRSATPEAQEVLHFIVATRLRRGLLTVVDATNARRQARQSLLELAAAHDVPADAIVFDVPAQEAIARNLAKGRTGRAEAVARQDRDLQDSLRGLRREGFRQVHLLNAEHLCDPAAVVVTPERPRNDRRDLTGPFDVIGDVHGCLPELVSLLTELGWSISHNADGRPIGATHPAGRTAVFVGDLVDRGPDTPGVLRLVMGMTRAGTALCVAGNHEVKLARALKGAKVPLTHGIDLSLEQLAAAGLQFKRTATSWLDSLPAHYLLDGGRLVVAHAGLKEAYHGRQSSRVRAFALHGDVTGERDEHDLPVRLPWERDYRGQAAVVYGHIPTVEARWLNNTICLDTGAVFGGRLTALRYPERELVSVPARRQYATPLKPLTSGGGDDHGADTGVLPIDDVLGTRFLETSLAGPVEIPAAGAAAALETMSRFGIDPRWLAYLPPTEEAADGPTRPGLRAIAVLVRDEAAARRRFAPGPGHLYDPLGRPVLAATEGRPLVERLRRAATPLFDALDSDWLVLDGYLCDPSQPGRSTYVPTAILAAAGRNLARTQDRQWQRTHLSLLEDPAMSLDLDLVRGNEARPLNATALNQQALGLEALTRFVDGAPLWQVHQLVFGVLALGGQHPQ